MLKKVNIPIRQSGEASQWRVCYQRGLPCLVLVKSQFEFLSLVAIWVLYFFHHIFFKFLSEFEFLSFVLICVVGFCHHFNFMFCHSLCFWVVTILRRQKGKNCDWIFPSLLSLLLQPDSDNEWRYDDISTGIGHYCNLKKKFVTIWVFDLDHNLRFWVLSQFELLSFFTIF